MKKLFFILALLNVAYGQNLWRLVETKILPIKTNYTLNIDTARIYYIQVYQTLEAGSGIFENSVGIGSSGGVNGSLYFLNDLNGFRTTILSSTTTANKTLTLPNKNGTIEAREKNIVTVTTNHTVQDSNDVVLVSCSSANITITLPAAASYQGRVFHIKKIDATGYSVIIDGNSAETIDGNATITFSGQYTSYTIISNGTNWYIL